MVKNTVIILISSLLLAFSSCGNKKDGKVDSNLDVNKVADVDTTGAVSGDWIVIRDIADPDKLNPVVSTTANADEVQSYIFETLLNQDRITYDLIPGLADMPEISPDNLSYIFRLKKNITFSDGNPLTAEDVVFTLKVVKNPYVDDAALRNYFEMVSKAELVNGDPLAVKFSLSKPNWRGIWTLASFKIMCKRALDPQGITDKIGFDELKDFNTAAKDPAIQKYADFMNSQEVSREAKYLIGTGPYVFEKWETGAGITIRRNPKYWDAVHTPNYPNRILFKTINDNSAALVAAKNKEIDAMSVLTPTDFYKNLEKPDEFKLIKAKPSEPSYTYIGWNELNPLFQDKKVRMALSYLFDRKTIIDKILYGDAVPIQSHIFYQNKKLLNTDLPIIEFSPEKAKQILNDAGWKDTDGDGVIDKVVNGKKMDFKFTFLIYNNPVRKQILLIYIDALKKAGIQADLQELEWSVYIDKTKKHEFEATYSAWTSPTSPPDPFQIWHSTQSQGEGSNFISFKNEESDKMIEAYRDEMDENKRIEIIKKWQKLIYDEQPYTFLWAPTARYIYDIRFKNTRWYNYQPSPAYNEWWVPKSTQKYTQTMN